MKPNQITLIFCRMFLSPNQRNIVLLLLLKNKAKIKCTKDIINQYLIFIGLVAQWTRACGYEPQSRGFESLLAQFLSIHYFRTKDFFVPALIIFFRMLFVFLLKNKREPKHSQAK